MTEKEHDLEVSFEVGGVSMTRRLFFKIGVNDDLESRVADWSKEGPVTIYLDENVVTRSAIAHDLAHLILQEPAPTGLLLDWLTSPEYADEAVVNITNRYPYWVEKHGRRWAKIIFYTQTAGCVLSCWSDWVMKRLNLLKLWRPSS